jgi:hypothetical protein
MSQAGADRVGRDHDHRSGRAREGPGRGGSLDAHRALNDSDTGAEVGTQKTVSPRRRRVRLQRVLPTKNARGEFVSP